MCGALQWVTPADLAGSVVFDRWDKSEQVTRDRFSGCHPLRVSVQWVLRPLSREEPRGAESEHEMTVFLQVTRERTLWVDESELPYTF